jgi:TolB-like protein
MRERPLSVRLDRSDAPRGAHLRARARLAAAFVGVAVALTPAHAGADPAAAASTAAAPLAVAVLYFDYEGKNPELEPLRKGLAQMLTTDLAELEAIQVVERARLEEVLAELALGRSSKVDRTSAARVGKLLGARLLVLGSFFEIGGALRVDARVVDAETGRVVKGAGVRGRSDDALSCEASLAEKLRDALGAIAVRPPGPATTPVSAKGHGPPRAGDSTVSARPVRQGRASANAAPGAKVHVSALAAYGRALDALDRNDKGGARTALESAVQISPGFALAAGDLARLPP